MWYTNKTSAALELTHTGCLSVYDLSCLTQHIVRVSPYAYFIKADCSCFRCKVNFIHLGYVPTSGSQESIYIKM